MEQTAQRTVDAPAAPMLRKILSAANGSGQRSNTRSGGSGGVRAGHYAGDEDDPPQGPTEQTHRQRRRPVGTTIAMLAIVLGGIALQDQELTHAPISAALAVGLIVTMSCRPGHGAR